MKRHPLKVLVAVCVGLLLAEGLLWAAHFAVGGSGRVAAGGDVLCIGDSHTFGWNVDAASAYPARLEALLAPVGLDVTNRGAAGKNTRTLLEELDEYLQLDAPQIVLILAGLNNPWSRPPADLSVDAEPPGLLGKTRLARFVRIAAARFEGERRGIGVGDGSGAGSVEERELEDGRTEVRVVNREGVVETFTVGGGTVSHDEAELAHQWIQHDLGALAARARAFGAEPVLLTYAVENSDTMRAVNASIRAAAKEHDVPLIDVARAMLPGVEAFGEERLVFPDAHPRVEGYRAVARIVHDGLVAKGLIDAEPVGDPLAPLRTKAAPAPTLAATPDGSGGFELELSFDPVLAFSVVLSNESLPPAAAATWLGLPLPVAQDALFSASANAESLRGTFDADGKATLHVDAATLTELAGPSGPVHAVLVGRTKGWTLLAASAPVQLR